MVERITAAMGAPVGIFNPEAGWRSGTLSALVLVLLASCCVHHDFAEYGGRQRNHHLFFA
jgi:hypothetical protein